VGIGINEYKRFYQPRSNLLKDENGDLLADSHSIFSVTECAVSMILGRQKYIQPNH
jgi:hypothetical protein